MGIREKGGEERHKKQHLNLFQLFDRASQNKTRLDHTLLHMREKKEIHFCEIYHIVNLHHVRTRLTFVPTIDYFVCYIMNDISLQFSLSNLAHSLHVHCNYRIKRFSHIFARIPFPLPVVMGHPSLHLYIMQISMCG